MGKGGMSIGDNGEDKEENMAAWLLGINNLKIQPFKLPVLGIHFSTINSIISFWFFSVFKFFY